MAAAPWAKTGAWATQVEEEEEKHGGELPAVFGGAESFPSLGAAAQVKETKKEKKKKGQPLSLGTFLQSSSSSRGGGRSTAIDDADLLQRLPTAPRARDPDEDVAGPGLGGGFRDYGGDRGGRGGDRFGDREDRFERRRRDEDVGPSRADEADDWGRERKFQPGGYGGDRGGFGERRGGGFGDRGGGSGGFDRERPPRDEGPSRADEVDSWGRKPSAGGGFGDRDRYGGGDRQERRGFSDYGAPRGVGFEDRPRRREYDLGTARADESDQWKRRDAPPAPERGSDRGPSVADSADRWGSRGGAAAAPTERPGSRDRPKLNLKPRTVPLDAAPAAAAGGSKGSNPFGAARPREEVLKEQGRDFVKEDLELEHKTVERPETAEEKAMREEVEELKKQAAEEPGKVVVVEQLGQEERPVEQAVVDLEAKLLKLALELDDKVRFSKPPHHGPGGPPPREGRGPREDKPPATRSDSPAAPPADAPVQEDGKKW